MTTIPGYDAWKLRSDLDEYPDYDQRDEWEPEGPYPEEECGRWRNGKLAPLGECLSAGTEFCQLECPMRAESVTAPATAGE